jgi:hypothetical protein
MDLLYCTSRLESNAQTFRALLGNVAVEQARWKPYADKWSLLEVINHLADEEIEDFGTRLRLVLQNPGQDWPGIDPEGWAVERNYNSRDVRESLVRFLDARNNSLAWLKTLPPVDWNAAGVHPRFGAIRAGDLLHSWVAHDFIHVRQMNRLHYQYLSLKKYEYDLGYAGNW